MININSLLYTAQQQLGTKEYPANSNNVKYNTWYYGRAVSGKDYPWCMAFVQWCFDQIGCRLQFMTASCSALLNWYKNNKPECIVSEPLPGDIVIYDFGHTGIVESASVSTITAIEGNTSSGSAGSQSNGGGVFRRVRSKALVIAYIRPYPEMTVKEEDDDMDVARFKELWGEMRKELQDNDSGQWSEEARNWATSTGLIVGMGVMPNGEQNYAWADVLTREQMAVLLYRFAKMMGRA